MTQMRSSTRILSHAIWKTLGAQRAVSISMSNKRRARPWSGVSSPEVLIGLRGRNQQVDGRYNDEEEGEEDGVHVDGRDEVDRVTQRRDDPHERLRRWQA